MIDTEHVVQRFLKYVSFDTQSDEDNDAVCPSTPGQLVFAKALAEELNAIGLSDVTLDEHGYIMATLPANGAEGPVVGFISHVDTSPDASGKDIKPVSLIMMGRTSSSTKHRASSFRRRLFQKS